MMMKYEIVVFIIFKIHLWKESVHVLQYHILNGAESRDTKGSGYKLTRHSSVSGNHSYAQFRNSQN